MTNSAYRYEGYELWQDEKWADRISRIDGLIQYLTANCALDIGAWCRPALSAEISVKNWWVICVRIVFFGRLSALIFSLID